MAIWMLVIVAVFTAFKLALTAIPLADAIVETNLHTEGVLPPIVLFLYRFSIIGSAMLVGTFGLIYFKLLAENSGTRSKIEASKRDHWWQVEWWSPRLPRVLVYLSIVVIVIVSNIANTTVFDYIFSNTLVVVELALSYPVGLWMSKRQSRGEAVSNELREQLKAYDHRMKFYETDKDYLRLFLQNASEAFFKLKGTKRKNKYPNAYLREEDSRVVEKIIFSEYRRLRGGVGFSKMVGEWVTDEPEKIVEASIHQTIVTNTQPIVVPSREILSPSVLRLPPSGAVVWTHDSMVIDLMAVGASKPLKESFINATYAKGHNAREVWRKSVRSNWNG